MRYIFVSCASRLPGCRGCFAAKAFHVTYKFVQVQRIPKKCVVFSELFELDNLHSWPHHKAIFSAKRTANTIIHWRSCTASDVTRGKKKQCSKFKIPRTISRWAESIPGSVISGVAFLSSQPARAKCNCDCASSLPFRNFCGTNLETGERRGPCFTRTIKVGSEEMTSSIPHGCNQDPNSSTHTQNPPKNAGLKHPRKSNKIKTNSEHKPNTKQNSHDKVCCVGVCLRGGR